MSTITAENINFRADIEQKTAKQLIWIALMSIFMLFAGLTSAVIVMKPASLSTSFEFPTLFLINTIVILLSSLAFHMGLIAVKKDQLNYSKMAFISTLLLGVVFGFLQYKAWQELVANGVFLSGGGALDSFFYVLTGLHLAHMIGGIISLIVIVIKSVREKYNSKNYLRIEVSITYWHFLTALWIYLFFFLKFIAQ